MLSEIVGDVGDKNIRKLKSEEELGRGMGNLPFYLPFYLSLLSIQFHTDNTDKPLKPSIGEESDVGVVSAVSVGRRISDWKIHVALECLLRIAGCPQSLPTLQNCGYEGCNFGARIDPQCFDDSDHW
mgnify:FL=1